MSGRNSHQRKSLRIIIWFRSKTNGSFPVLQVIHAYLQFTIRDAIVLNTVLYSVGNDATAAIMAYIYKIELQ